MQVHCVVQINAGQDGEHVCLERRDQQFEADQHDIDRERQDARHSADRAGAGEDEDKGREHFEHDVSGDHVRFLTDKEGLSFPEAVTRLAEMAGVPLPSSDPAAEQRDKARAGLHEIMEMAARFFEAFEEALMYDFELKDGAAAVADLL